MERDELEQVIQEMIRIARPGTKIVIADEAERLARLYDRLPGSRSRKGQAADVAVSIHLVPDAMRDVRMDGIWTVHGQPHGYCLEFRKLRQLYGFRPLMAIFHS
jgi:hypothetical protein